MLLVLVEQLNRKEKELCYWMAEHKCTIPTILEILYYYFLWKDYRNISLECYWAVKTVVKKRWLCTNAQEEKNRRVKIMMMVTWLYMKTWNKFILSTNTRKNQKDNNNCTRWHHTNILPRRSSLLSLPFIIAKKCLLVLLL